MTISRPTLLSLNGGYVDTAGFLALQGLFTAHVTGNFVTLGASLAHGFDGGWAKVLALPVFCVVVVLVRWSGVSWTDGHPGLLRGLLAAKLMLLSVACAGAIAWGPFPDVNSPAAIVVGLGLVAAMAIQNALHRIHLGSAPPSTLMTGSTTQIMVDIADRLTGRTTIAGRARLPRMAAAVAGFAVGCSMAALFYVVAGMWCFAVPPIVALLTVIMPDVVPVPAAVAVPR